MCLEIEGLKVYQRPLKKTVEGWKVFCLYDGELSGEIYDGDRPTDRWLHAHKCNRARVIRLDGGLKYPAGFHVFLSRAAAVRWSDSRAIRKVKVRGIVASGVQETSDSGVRRMDPCVVGLELFIPKARRK